MSNNTGNLILKDGKCASCGRRPEQHKASAQKKNPTWDRIKCRRLDQADQGE